MKKTATFLFLFLCVLGFAQNPEEESVRRTVDVFFTGFHNKDSAMMESAIAKSVIVQTVTKDLLGNTIVKNESYLDFLNSIVSIPDDVQFEEKLLNAIVQIDGAMAHVWAPYEFWFNGQLSHCGVNSMQLAKIDGYWKLIYLIDTRRKDNCSKG